MDQMSIFEANQMESLKLIEGDNREDIDNKHKIYHTKYIDTSY